MKTLILNVVLALISSNAFAVTNCNTVNSVPGQSTTFCYDSDRSSDPRPTQTCINSGNSSTCTNN